VLRHEPTTAPDSPGRILRELRLTGKLNYVVINRRQSLYQFRAVRKPGLFAETEEEDEHDYDS
jgi:hypothetical protein